MKKDTNTGSVNYRVDYLILLTLVVLTLLTVGLSGTKLGIFAVAGTLIFSGIEAFLLLWHFMGLRYKNKIYSVMVALILLVLVVVLAITFKDPGI